MGCVSGGWCTGVVVGDGNFTRNCPAEQQRLLAFNHMQLKTTMQTTDWLNNNSRKAHARHSLTTHHTQCTQTKTTTPPLLSVVCAYTSKTSLSKIANIRQKKESTRLLATVRPREKDGHATLECKRENQQGLNKHISVCSTAAHEPDNTQARRLRTGCVCVGGGGGRKEGRACSPQAEYGCGCAKKNGSADA